jgi:hypothetical protein
MIDDNSWAVAVFANASVKSTATIAIDRRRRTVTDGRLISAPSNGPDDCLLESEEPCANGHGGQLRDTRREGLPT